jgi:hypothetical protein
MHLKLERDVGDLELAAPNDGILKELRRGVMN